MDQYNMVLTWPSEKSKTASVEWFNDNGGGNIPPKKDPKKEKDSGNIKVSRGAVCCDCDTIEVTDDDSSDEMQTETSV